MLNETRRLQLDNIVKQMASNREPDNNIQFVVDDFKKKYENEQTVQPITENKPIGSKVLDVAKNIGGAVGELNKGLAKDIGKTVLNVGKIGSNVLSKIPIIGGGQKQIDETNKFFQDVEKKLQPSNTLQKIGGFGGEMAQFLTPVGAETATVKIATILDKVLSKAPNIIKSGSKLLAKSGIAGAEFAGKTAIMTGDKQKTKEAGIIGAATPPVVSAAAKTGKFVFGQVFPSILSGMTGIAPEAIKSAFKNPVETAKYMASRVIPVDVRERAVQSLDKYVKIVGDSFENGLNALKKENKTGVPFYPNTQLTKQVNDATNGLPSIFRKFAVGVKQNVLDFSKSAIVKASEQRNLQAVFDTIKNQKDYSVQGVQRIAARINALSKFTEGAKEESSAIIGKIHDIYSKAIDKSFPKLGELRAEYANDMEIITGIDNILKSAKNDIANPTTSTSVAKKLVNLFNEDNEAYVRALKRLEEATGDDLINQFVAANFDKIMPGKLASYMAQAGLIAGGVFYNPLLIAVLPLFSPRLAGKILTGTGKATKTIETVGRSFPSSIKNKIIPASIIGGE